MTLLIVHNDTVYCDSYCTNGESDSSSDKIRVVQWVEQDEIVAFSVAGSPDAGTAVMEFVASHKPSEWPTLDLSRFGKDTSHTVVVFRRKGISRPGVIDLALEYPQVRPVLSPEGNGLQFMAGSGWNYFSAFYHEHNDITKALSLTAAHHRDVSRPFRTF